MAELTGKAAAPAAIPATKPEAVGQAPNPALNADPSKTSNTLRAVSAPFQIQTMHERARWLKMLVYGKHGAGKTELVASAVDVPQMRDVLFISAESGESTVDDNDRIKNADKIHFVRVTTFKQAAYIQDFLVAYCKARDRDDVAAMKKLYCQVTGYKPEELSDDRVPRFRTVILDSLSEIEVYCTYGLLSIDTSKVVSDEIEVADWPVFRKNNEMVKLLVRAFRDLPMHVLLVCAEQYTQDEIKRFHYSPQLTGKLSAQVQGFVDIVGWITVGQATNEQPEAPRRVYVQPVTGGPKFDAKNRKSVFKQTFFENPNMMSIMRDTGMLK